MRNPYLRILVISLLAPTAGMAQFGTNLIVNGDAESGAGSGSSTIVASIPGWTSAGANVITYASNYGITLNDLVPIGAGKNYFSNGNTSSSITQTVSVAFAATAIDAGTASYDASGYFGGYSSYDDTATLNIVFLNASGTSVGTVSIGGVKSADRNGTGMYLRRQIGAVPSGARSAKVTVNFVITTSSVDNAGADNLSLKVNSQATSNTVFGSNLIVNGNAESAAAQLLNADFSADIPSWVRSANFTTDGYGLPDADLDFTTPGPPDEGKQYFYGGPSNPASSAYQDIDISQSASIIDAGVVKYSLIGWLGGYSSQNDNAVLTVQFMNWGGTVLGTVTLGPVLAADRNNQSGLLQRTATGTIPAGARMAHLLLSMTRTDGSDNDGIADSLSLILINGGAPTISTNGIATAAAFGGSPTIAPGTWIEIYGQNLAPDAREWAGGDFSGSTAPISLDGVKVTVGGQSAFVRYISAGQVNVQVPSNAPTGQQQIVVSTALGTSAPYAINVASTQGSVLAPSTFVVSGKQYLAALFADGVTFALPPNTLPGVTSRYAKPGDTLVVYGVGFGPTVPAISAGQITSQANSLASPLQVSFGGIAGTLTYMGLSPSYVGLYQFNIVVPNVANNDFVPIVFTLGATPIAQTVYTAIHN